jgi:predicted methyltransferase
MHPCTCQFDHIAVRRVRFVARPSKGETMFAECARRIVMALGLFALLGATAGTWAQSAPDYAALVAAPDRSDADRQADKRRDPLPFLAFAGLRPGMKVLDMGAGGGYSAELIARAVAAGGVVYAQNPSDLFEKPKAAFEARLKTPAMKNVVADIRPFDDPVPPEVQDLDLITFLFFYHDTTYMNVDRAEMNRKLFAALKPGGFLLIADHFAAAGQGTSVGKTLHRIEESALRARKSKRPAFGSLPRAISGVIRTTPAISRVTVRSCPSTISCSNFRSRCKTTAGKAGCSRGRKRARPTCRATSAKERKGYTAGR